MFYYLGRTVINFLYTWFDNQRKRKIITSFKYLVIYLVCLFILVNIYVIFELSTGTRMKEV